MKRILLIGLTILVLVGMGFASPAVVLASDRSNGNPSDLVPFSSIGMEVDTSLTGPFNSLKLQFNLPPDWKLLPGAQLELNLTKYFSSLVVGQSSLAPQGLVAGNLGMTFNGVPLQTTILQDNGDITVSIPLPDTALQPDTLTRMHELIIQWDASASCDFNLATSVVIHPDSSFNLPHETVDLDLDLAWWPGPLYLENSPESAGVTLIIPDQATQKDLQAALAVAAGLGRLSQNKLDLVLTPVSQLPTGKRDKDNLIMIGKLNSLDFFKEISLSEIGATESDGIVKMMVSPWNKKRVVVVVTGGNDEALLKAGEALNAGTIISYSEKNIAVIQDIVETTGVGNYNEDISFGKLTTEEISFQTFGTSVKKFPFTLPANMDIGADAYIDLVFNHSQLIDYLRSGIVIKINDLPVGSVRLSDATSGLNLIRLIVPPTVVHAGLNQLEIQVDLIPRTICTDPRRQSLWVTIFTDSLLHLPLGSQPLSQLPAENLGQYPWPLANDLSDSAIILPSNNPPSWYVAARLVYDLGGRSGSPGYPEVLFADKLPASALPDKNLLIIGSPAELPIMGELNKVLPGPFDSKNELAAEIGARINYRITPQQTVGYLELAQSSPSGKIIYAVMGSNGEGVQRAGNALLNPGVLKKLSAGNLAIIQGDKLAVENITLSQQAALTTPEVQGTPGATPGSPGEGPLFKHESWILPAIILSLGFIILLIGLEILVTLQRKKT